MLKFSVTVDLDMESGKATTYGRAVGDKATTAAIIASGQLDEMASDGKALAVVLEQAAEMFYATWNNEAKDDLDTAILESIVVSSGVMDKIMNRMGKMIVHMQNGNVEAAVSTDIGMFLASVDNFERQHSDPAVVEVDNQEMARRRAIMIPHPDGGA